MKTALELIAEERQRQINSEGFNIQHDDWHAGGEIAIAAACYAMPSENRQYSNPGAFVPTPIGWPWKAWWKPSPENRIRELVKAGALIIAEIERLQRKSMQHEKV